MKKRDGTEAQEDAITEAVNVSRHFVRHQRALDYEACADIASRQPTGLAAASAILATLRRSQEKPL